MRSPPANAAGPASFAGGDLIGLLRDHDLDASGVQRPAEGAGRVRLVGEHCVWCGARTTSAQAGDADVGQDRAEQGPVVAVSAGDDRGERAATPVDGGVDLRGQPAPGAVSYTHLRAHETDSYLVCRL